MTHTEIRESNEQFQGAWSLFAERSPAGELLRSPEVVIASSNVSWALMNAAFLPSELETEAELQRAITAAARYFQPKGRGWMFALCQDWLTPALRARAPELLGAHGLKPALELTGMVADQLLPPSRALAALDMCPVSDAKGRQMVADINAHSYGAPVAVGREGLDVAAFYANGALGMVGHRGGHAATCTAVFNLGGVAYVALVATMTEHRRQGLAETVMRHALAEAGRAWGLQRTVLHATEAGLPIYQRMGYRIVTRFPIYMVLPEGH